MHNIKKKLTKKKRTIFEHIWIIKEPNTNLIEEKMQENKKGKLQKK